MENPSQYIEYVHYAAYGIAAVAVLGGAVWVCLWVWRRVLGQAKSTSEQAKDIVKEVEHDSRAGEYLKKLSAVLERLEQADTEKSAILIKDAQVLTGELVRAVKALAEQASRYRANLEILREAEDAIRTADHSRLAYCAGRLASWDSQLCLHLSDRLIWSSDRYRESASGMLGVTIGDVENWATAFDDYSAGLVHRLSTEKARLRQIEAAVDFVPVAKNLVLLERDLTSAEALLRIEKPSDRHLLANQAGPAARLLR